MDNRKFVEIAHPHSWMLVADNLFEQSVVLHEQLRSSETMQKDAKGAIIGAWSSSNRSTFLLAGFALENAIKAFLVYEHPEWVSNGILARPLRSHALVHLSNMSSLIPWKKRGPVILSRFEQGLESWARYPCALTASATDSEQNLPPALWSGYLGLMRAYGKAIMALLQRGWDGPHGVGGHFEFQGCYLGAQSNPAVQRNASGRR